MRVQHTDRQTNQINSYQFYAGPKKEIQLFDLNYR